MQLIQLPLTSVKDTGDSGIKRIRIFVISRGSAKETWTAIHKAKEWNLISEDEFNSFKEKLDRYFGLMYGYIKSIGSTNYDDNEM